MLNYIYSYFLIKNKDEHSQVTNNLTVFEKLLKHAESNAVAMMEDLREELNPRPLGGI